MDATNFQIAQIWIPMLVQIISATGIVIIAVFAIITHFRIRTLESGVNGRMTQLLQLATATGNLQGRTEQIAERVKESRRQ